MMKYIPYIPRNLLCYFTMLGGIRDSSFIQLARHSWVLVDASCESMYSRVSLMLSRESFAGSSTTYPRMCFLTFKYKTRTNWRLVNPFNLISLTATTSPTFENCLHPYKYKPWGGCWLATLGEQSYAGGLLTEVFGAVKLRILWL